MKISTIQSLDIRDYIGLPTNELRKVVSDIARTLNPQINRLYSNKNSGKIADDALSYIDKSGGLFTTVGNERRTAKGEVTFQKTHNELVKEVARAQHFARMETRTVSGAKRVQKERESILQKAKYKGEIPEMFKTQKDKDIAIGEAWDDFHKFIESHQTIPYKVAQELYLSKNRGSEEDFFNTLDEYNKTAREEEEQAYGDIIKKTGYKPDWEGF